MNLCGQIGRGVEEDPIRIIARNRDTRLGTSARARVAGPSETTTHATAIPLRESTTRRSAENNGAQRHGVSLQLGRSVSVDFHADADFNEFRRVPSHVWLLSAMTGDKWSMKRP
jgi:hypothetical protein